MRIEHYPVKKLKKEILAIIRKYLDLEMNQYKIFFFGSRVDGKGNENSDIDIGIEGQAAISGRIMSRIKEDIENLPILYKIEIVDFQNVSPDFKKVALQKIEIIY